MRSARQRCPHAHRSGSRRRARRPSARGSRAPDEGDVVEGEIVADPGFRLAAVDYYLDEFAFRFNRRNSKARGVLFYRLAQQAVAIGPATYRSIVNPNDDADHHPRRIRM
jgi:hypothetical protein